MAGICWPLYEDVFSPDEKRCPVASFCILRPFGGCQINSLILSYYPNDWPIRYWCKRTMTDPAYDAKLIADLKGMTKHAAPLPRYFSPRR